MKLLHIGIQRCLTVAALCAMVLLVSARLFAQEHASGSHPSGRADSTGLGSTEGQPERPADARDPDAYADGFEHLGMTHADRLAIGSMLAEELEFVSGNEGQGGNWHLQASYGGDFNKFWLRTQGLAVKGPIDPTTSVEGLWWHSYSAFWGTVVGIRRDFGPGAHTWLAFGVEGLSPYRFHINATGYVGEDGRLSARLKASYDLLFTNRWILSAALESNVYSRVEPDRALGSGVGNLEIGPRLRYEVSRKFAPYVGYVWEQSFAGTADFRRADREPVTEHRLVVGVRLWR